jgi:UDP-glucose 4-epimerase
VGSTIVGRLLDDNRVTVYDSFVRDSLSSKPFAEHENLTIIRGDILDAGKLNESVADAQIVIHCAAIAGIDTVVKRPTYLLKR